MKIDIELSEEQLVNLVKSDYANDVNFLFKLCDEAIYDYDKTNKLIKRLLDGLPAGFRIEIEEYINEKSK